MQTRTSRIILVLIVPVLTLAAWWIYSNASSSYAFPPLNEIVTRFQELWLFDRLFTDVIPSLIRFVIGYIGGSIIGLALGIWLGTSQNVRDILDPAFQFVRSLPPPALLPLFLMIFGLGDTMKIFIIVFGAIWPVLLNTTEGIRGIDPTLRGTFSIYRISPLKKLTEVTLPAAANSIFAGL